MRQLDGNLISALPLFIKNFKKGDEELLTNPVKSVRVYFDGIDWHSILSDVIFMSDDKLKAPAELLRYLYKKNYCSFCRESVLRIMSKRKLLTDGILQECLYDSSFDIRRFAERKLNTK